MLTVLILTAIVYIFNMRLTAEFIPCTKLLLILGAVAGVIFFITESIIGYEKGKLDAYKKKWDEPGLIFAGITYTVALTVFTMAIANNIMKGEKVFSSFVIGMILVILVHDIINVCVIVFDKKYAEYVDGCLYYRCCMEFYNNRCADSNNNCRHIGWHIYKKMRQKHHDLQRLWCFCK